MNIIFIGMPGSGKSTLGVVTAKILGMDFLDSDVFIQNNENRKLQEIINKDGTESFLETECKNILKIDVNNTVIATGGSAVLKDEAMKHLKKDAITVFLDIPLYDLKKRIYNTSDRGIAMKDGETIDDIYRIRRPYYKKYADITVKTGHMSSRTAVGKVVDAIRKKINS